MNNREKLVQAMRDGLSGYFSEQGAGNFATKEENMRSLAAYAEEIHKARKEICQSFITLCEDISIEEMEDFVKKGAYSPLREVEALKKSKLFDERKRRANFSNIIWKAAQYLDGKIENLDKYELDIINDITYNVHNIINANTDSSFGIEVTHPEIIKGLLLSTIEEFLWGDKGSLLDFKF